MCLDREFSGPISTAHTVEKQRYTVDYTLKIIITQKLWVRMLTASNVSTA